MRSVISFILVLAFCLSFAAFSVQATSSAADGGTPAEVPANGESNSRTGDEIMVWVALMVLALIALAAVVVMYCKFVR